MPVAFQGRDLAVTSWESDIPAPAHHYFMFYDTTPTPGTQPVPCEGSTPVVQASSAGLNLFSMGALLLVSGTGHQSFVGEAGYGMVLQANGSFVTNHHVINAGATPVTVHASFKLTVQDAVDVPHPTRALSCQTTDISLPPGGKTDVTATCLAPYDLDVVTMSSHAHQDLMTFEQRFFDGTQTQPAVLYTSSVWDTPLVQQMTTPLHLKAGQGITFTCHYMNQTGAQIGFGLTADSEMCAAMDDYAYPADKTHEVPPMLGTDNLLERDAVHGEQHRQRVHSPLLKRRSPCFSRLAAMKMQADIVDHGATFSECRRYRYLLWRGWSTGRPAVAFVGLNPSTADGEEDDPTIRKCVTFARAWGFGRVFVLNVFAWRATESLRLLGVEDPVGRENDATIAATVRAAACVVMAWGRFPRLRSILGDRVVVVRRLLREHARDAGHLGLNGDGSPRHPLYLKGTTALTRSRVEAA